MHPIAYGHYLNRDEEDEDETPITLVEVPKSVEPPAKGRGAYCRGKDCGQYNEWADGDSDGTYVCYICREHHRVR